MVKLDLDEQANWADSADLAMMFRGTYSTSFYRRLHLGLHDLLDLRRRDTGLSRCRHPLLDDVPIRDHRARVAERWAELRAGEPDERTEQPTRLRIPVLAEP